jgi:hypothetical protein
MFVSFERCFKVAMIDQCGNKKYNLTLLKVRGPARKKKGKEKERKKERERRKK